MTKAPVVNNHTNDTSQLVNSTNSTSHLIILTHCASVKYDLNYYQVTCPTQSTSFQTSLVPTSFCTSASLGLGQDSNICRRNICIFMCITLHRVS